MTREEYGKLAKQHSPKSRTGVNTLKAFVSGGLICVLGQGLNDLWAYLGLGERERAMLTAVTLITLAAVLTALHLYDDLAKHAGAGTLVPITGFANSMVSAAMEFRSEGIVLGMGTRMFVVAGPVLVFGLAVSVIYGLVYILFLC